MAKELKFKTDRDPSLMKDIIYRTPAKGWRPAKRFWSQCNINLETGITKYKYVVAKNKEQEKEWEEMVMGQVENFYKLMWGDRYDWFMQNAKYLIYKHGMKKFGKAWDKAIKEE
jgi:hypothetical protein